METNKDLEKFKDLLGNDFMELYSSIKEYLYINAFDLLNQETPSSKNDFIELIFKKIHFNPVDEEEMEEIHDDFYIN